jgi:hypothetical protein
MAWGDPKVDKPREEKPPARLRPGGRIVRSLKRFLITLSVALNIIFVSLLIAGYFIVKNVKKSGSLTNLQNIKSIEDLNLPDSMKNSDLMKKVLELQGQNIRVINDLSEDGEADKK